MDEKPTYDAPVKRTAAPLPLSDTLVFVGVAGDLAHKKIIPALQSMLLRGNLNVPVIGVDCKCRL